MFSFNWDHSEITVNQVGHNGQRFTCQRTGANLGRLRPWKPKNGLMMANELMSISFFHINFRWEGQMGSASSIPNWSVSHCHPNRFFGPPVSCLLQDVKASPLNRFIRRRPSLELIHLSYQLASPGWKPWCFLREKMVYQCWSNINIWREEEARKCFFSLTKFFIKDHQPAIG